MIDFEKEVGASGTAEYNLGGVAYFTFTDKPCMQTWKKRHDGFMPRLGSKEGKALQKRLFALPRVGIIDDCLDAFKLNNMMVLGEATSTGVRMHGATFCGKHESKTYFIKVPQVKGQEYKPISSDMVECKEWEMLKFMDS